MITWADRAELHELLGKPIYVGKRLLMLSSVNPGANRLILHSALDGERIASPIDEFLSVWRKSGYESEEPWPSTAVLSQPGKRAEDAHIGPNGGLKRG